MHVPVAGATRWLASMAIVVLCLSCAPTLSALDAPQLAPGRRSLTFQQDVQLFELANGLVVALVPERGTNLAKVDVRYRFGAAEDPRTKAGMAHLAEHLTFTVTAANAGPSISDALGKISLHHNAFTNWDETHYTTTILSHNLMAVLQLERRRMAANCQRISDAVFARERQVVVQELLQRNMRDGDRGAPLRVALFGADHAYARSVGGTTTQVQSITKREACDFIRRFYGPARAVLVVSGKFDAKQVRGVVGGLFGPVERASPPPHRKVAPMSGRKRTKLRTSGKRSAVVIAFPAAPWGSKAHVVDRILAEILSNKLAREARDLEYITDVNMEHLGGYRGGARAFVLWLDKPTDSAQALRFFTATRDKAFAKVVSDVVVPRLNRDKLRILRHVEPFDSRASLVADYIQYAPDLRLLVGELNRIGEATEWALASAARNAFKLNKARVIRLEPSESGEATHDRAPLAISTKRYDFEAWREPVNADDAFKALPIPRAAHVPRTIAYTLDNGLRVLLVPDLKHPLVDARLVFPAGSEWDPVNKKGLSRLAANLLGFDTTTKLRPSHYRAVRYVESMGSQLSISVRERASTFHARGLAINVDGVLWQLHAWINSGVYDKKDLDRVHKRATAARPDAEDKRRRRLSHLLGKAVYGDGHPYVPVPHDHDLRRISVADLNAYKRLHYRARGATLIVTGKFDANDVRARVKRLFGSMVAGNARPTPRPIPPARPRKGPTYISVVDKMALQPAVLVAFPTAPGATTNGAARRVLQEMLRQRMRRIRTRYGATYGISVSSSRRRGPGALFITGRLDPNHGGKALAAMLNALDELRRGKDLERNFVRARRRVFGQLLASTADSDSIGWNLERANTHGLPSDHARQLAVEVAHLRPSAVRALITTELSPKRTVVVVAGARATLTKLYQAAGITPLRTIE